MKRYETPIFPMVTVAGLFFDALQSVRNNDKRYSAI
jgi:hypothetical protein